MPSTGQTVTKPSVITEFISRVMDPAVNTGRWWFDNDVGSGVLPRFDHRWWDNGTIVYSGPSPVMSTAGLMTAYRGLDNPTEGQLTNLVVGNEILDLLRSYAYNTTVIRRVRYGKYYTNYSHANGTRTPVPSDNPDHAPYGYQGTFLNGTWSANIGTTDGAVDYTHMDFTFRQSAPLEVSGPTAQQLIDGSDLTDFFTRLRAAAHPDNHPIVDRRICHSSCHNNCHSSRGRR